MNYECKRHRTRRRLTHHSSFIIHHSPRGITLLEVLVSIFILTFGLLGVAALIPIGKLALVQTNIADRTGACGRAAMREVEVRRMLNPGHWCDATGTTVAPPGAFALDPMYFAVNDMLPSLGGVMPRLTFTGLFDTVPAAPPTQADLDLIADRIFRWNDDLIFTQAKDITVAADRINGERPVPMGASEGNFSWFLTVCPSPSDVALNVPVALRRDYTVSVVVCHKRDFAEGEHVSTVNFLGGVTYGGGTVELISNPGIIEHIQTDRWVLLVGGAVARWYRVVGVGNADSPYVTLVGPDWDGGATPTMVVVEGVTGVYTTNVHLDNDCVWTR